MFHQLPVVGFGAAAADADEDLRHRRVEITVVELGDVAFAERPAKLEKTARQFRNRHRQQNFAVFADLGSLGDVTQPVEIDVAPLSMAIRVCCCKPWRSAYFFKPATAKAPAGSATERVSSKMSLIAAQISSVPTVTTSSTHWRAILNGSAPICLTATPSANNPTCANTTRSPARNAWFKQSASSGSTAITLISGRTNLT